MFSLLWNMIHRREIITLTSDNRHIPDKTSGFQHALYEVDLSTPLTQSNDLMAILMVIVPTLTIGYIVETEGRSAVLSEKEKLSARGQPALIRHSGDRYDLSSTYHVSVSAH